MGTRSHWGHGRSYDLTFSPETFRSYKNKNDAETTERIRANSQFGKDNTMNQTSTHFVVGTGVTTYSTESSKHYNNTLDRSPLFDTNIVKANQVATHYRIGNNERLPKITTNQIFFNKAAVLNAQSKA